jgi:hypothetical protein
MGKFNEPSTPLTEQMTPFDSIYELFTGYSLDWSFGS